MKIFERIFYICIIILLIWMIIIQKNNPKTNTITIPGDSIPYNVEIIKPVPYDTIVYSIDTLWLVGDTVNIHDTVFIYNDYFKMYSYKVDTSGSDVYVSINSMITQNRLYKQDISILNNRETKIISDQSNLIGIGGIIGKDLVAPMVSYQFDKHEIGVGYNFVSNKTVIFTYQYKFSLK